MSVQSVEFGAIGFRGVNAIFQVSLVDMLHSVQQLVDRSDHQLLNSQHQQRDQKQRGKGKDHQNPRSGREKPADFIPGQ